MYHFSIPTPFNLISKLFGTKRLLKQTILDPEPNVHGWVQLPKLFLKPFDIDGLDVRYNFDDGVNFSRVESLPSYYYIIIAWEGFNMHYLFTSVKLCMLNPSHAIIILSY